MVSTSGTYCLRAVASMKFLGAENMPRQLHIVDWAGGSEWQSYRIIATRLVNFWSKPDSNPNSNPISSQIVQCNLQITQLHKCAQHLYYILQTNILCWWTSLQVTR